MGKRVRMAGGKVSWVSKVKQKLEVKLVIKKIRKVNLSPGQNLPKNKKTNTAKPPSKSSSKPKPSLPK